MNRLSAAVGKANANDVVLDDVVQVCAALSPDSAKIP